MTAKEKAKELVDKYVVYAKRPSIKGVSKDVWISEITENAIQCALICVDEMMKELDGFGNYDGYQFSRVEYWNEVKQEIQLLKQ